MNNISVFNKCANCGACYNICPRNAIYVKNGYPFFEVTVNEKECIDCGLCQNVCPVNKIEIKQDVISAYAGYNNDREKVRKSSSGGAFISLAEFILAQGGIVFGAAYSEDCKRVLIKSTDEVSLEDLLRSKYVESCVDLSFKMVEKELKKARAVLFCGAPCQVAGLKRFLRKDYDNLLTCDFSCGGMPSYVFYEEYLTDIEKKLAGKICEINFRPKTYGWNNYAIRIKAENGREYNNFAASDPYFYCFVGNHSSVRDYCYECNFANNHYADIILADFWLIKKASNIKDDDSGVSLIITNSPKGEKIIQAVKNKLTLTLLDKDKATYNLAKKQVNSEFLINRKNFIDTCKEKGFIKASKKLKLNSKFKLKLKYRIKKFLGRVR